MCIIFPSEDQLSIKIQDEERERQRKEKERNHLVSIGIAGFWISETSIKHRNIDHKDARRGNLVVVDVRSAKNTDDCVLGPWEKQYLIGVINKRQRTGPNLPEDDLTITLYEPWKVYDGLPSMPLWASIKIEGDDRDEHPIDSIAWVDLLQLPWLPVSQMPLEVHKALTESNGELYHKPPPNKVVTNYMGTGIDVVKMKPSYTNQQKAGTIKYIMQLDASEKLASDKMGLITMNKDTQRDLLNSVFNVL